MPRSSTFEKLIWGAFVLLVILPLYAVAGAMSYRTGLFNLKGAAPSDEQIKAVWAFVASGLAAGATVIGLLLTNSHNKRTLALQRDVDNRKQALDAETNERLKLDTVVAGLGLLSEGKEYAPKATVAGALATLVQLGHPIVAMRALSAAFDDGNVDRDTTTWLIGQVLLSSETRGTQSDLAAAKEEAAALLVVYAPKMTDGPAGRVSWPDAIVSQWPAGLSENVGQNLTTACVELILSQPKAWWLKGGGTYTWVIDTMEQVVRCERHLNVRRKAAALGLAFLEVTSQTRHFGKNYEMSKADLAKCFEEVQTERPWRLRPEIADRISQWGVSQPISGDPMKPIPVSNAPETPPASN